MDWLTALILGIVQGLTEFLPVSSSGHLEMARALLGENKLPEENLALTVWLHGGTALATLVVFRKDIGAIVTGALKKRGAEQRRYVAMIALSMVPAVVVGLGWEEQLSQLFAGHLLLVGSCLLFTAVLLYWAHVAHRREGQLAPWKALIVGIAQAIAILPGVSRSGATIGASLLLGINRNEAARFSFLMVVPLILGKMARDLLNMGTEPGATTMNLPILIGFLAALLVGIGACLWMIRLVQHSKLSWFALYCALVGTTAIVIDLAS